MAKKSMKAREVKRAKLIKRYAQTRASLKEQIKKATDFASNLTVHAKLQKLPRGSSATRFTRRCQVCGRPHAVYRKFGLCRICLRQALMQGFIPGGRKASW